MNIVSVYDMNVWYREGNNVLDNISFNISGNEIVGLLGLNGAGKTTLINVLSSIHSSYTVSDIKSDFSSKFEFSHEFWKKNRYTVFTEEKAFPYWTFFDYLDFVMSAYNKKYDSDKLETLLEGFAFNNYKNMPIGNLSTGNRKKVYLITGFLLELPLLILDEPIDGIDFLSTEFLYRQIKDYRNIGSVLMSSHIAESFHKTCDRILLLQDGNISNEDLSVINQIEKGIKI